MNTLTAKKNEQVRARWARVTAKKLYVLLGDGREISVLFAEVPWLKWLAKATPKQRANWLLEPGGYGIFWPNLAEGIEICRLLDAQPMV
jgi:Protein of unknown function (DUF2442)